MKRVVSGIKPTGEVTLGNYLGAMKRWAAEQTGERENFYFVPDLHALTSLRDPEQLRQNTLSAVAWLLVMGVDPNKSTIFVQSHVPAHAELCWILDNYVTMGELNRMTQFKDKSQQAGSEGQVVGLFNYPVLMAADILLYDADEVPVGDDQVQHVELVRDIAERFNNRHGQTFKLPQATVQKVGSKIMNLQDPNKKMSASDQDSSGVIFLKETSEEIAKKIRRATTDSAKDIKAAADKPGISNLLQILALTQDKSVAQVEKEQDGKSYAEFKDEVARAVVAKIEPINQKHQELMQKRTEIDKVISAGGAKANQIANHKIAEIKQKTGLLTE